MARKPSRNDLKAHETTYSGFIAMLKMSVVALIITILALYCFLEAGNPILGLILLLLIPVGALIKVATSLRS